MGWLKKIKSKYALPLLGLFLFIIILFVLLQMSNSISFFVRNQAKTDSETLTAEKASVVNAVISKDIMELDNILEYIELSHFAYPDEFYARENISKLIFSTQCSRFVYFMKDGRMYDNRAELCSTIEGDASKLALLNTNGVGSPYYDEESSGEMIVIYRENTMYPDSDVKGVAGYYFTASFYARSEFLDTTDRNLYIINKSGDIIFSQNEENKKIEDLLLNNNFIDEDYTNIISVINNGNKSFSVIGKTDGSVISINRVSDNLDWYVVSIIPSDNLSSKTDSVIKQSVIATGIILAVFIILLFYFFFSDYRYLHKVMRIQNTDNVAGCSNQSKFEVDAESLIKNNPSTNYGLVYLNIVNFRYISQLFGYSNTNKMMQYISEVIRKSLQNDLETYGRTSDGRMVCLFIYHETSELSERFKTIYKEMDDFEPSIANGYKVKLNAGIYCINRENDYTVAEMIDRAIFAQNSVQEGSLEEIAFYHQKSHADLLNIAAMESLMESALSNREFVVYFQPKYDIMNNRLDSAEALVRWIRPVDGIVPPSQFIPIFERNGFIAQLDKYVYKETCAFLKKRTQQKKRVVPISINVSRATAEAPDFIEYYCSVKKEYSIPDGFLELEFTESRALENYEILGKKIVELKTNGFLCSIDDFGAGYSSFKALKALSFNALKLDSFFLKNSEDTARDEKLIVGVIAMAKSLGMRVIAEGVDSKEKLRRLRILKCDVIQGYLYSRPITMDSFDNFLNDTFLGKKTVDDELKDDIVEDENTIIKIEESSVVEIKN